MPVSVVLPELSDDDIIPFPQLELPHSSND